MDKRKIIEKYLVKKGKTDLKSSLEALDKKLLKEKLEEFEVDSIKELEEEILDIFEASLSTSTGDIFTVMYFERVLKHENTSFFSLYAEDIESLWGFAYDTGETYKYYIPDEIKAIIKKYLDL